MMGAAYLLVVKVLQRQTRHFVKTGAPLSRGPEQEMHFLWYRTGMRKAAAMQEQSHVISGCALNTREVALDSATRRGRGAL